MDNIAINANAKVNLLLDVVGKRADGYHEMRMINHRLELSDMIQCKKTGAGISLKADSAQIPVDERNLSFKAAKRLLEFCELEEGVEIILEKKIPHEAGLAGGSSDAAATLLGLNQLFDLGLSIETLAQIGLTIGADVPYCLHQETALVEGIGEKITPLVSIGSWPVVLIKPEIGIKTSWAFSQLGDLNKLDHPDLDAALFHLDKKDYLKVFEVVGNVFEGPIFSIHPELKKLKETLLEYGALAANMTGSGSTIVGYFADEGLARRGYQKLLLNNKCCFLTKTC
ncbi:4-(cytidine 5'-diphospho)-2-C-methyl-D-erythritol kinase [Eubacteriaceae bacterium ES3]|nr:4-(cytidine 5'-diphospho)-2-C-methyl-D-erythritol kinase [Eubacteriaceae bacterium ES3]